MSRLLEQPISCPFCAEPMTILIDPSAGGQDYIEDCQVCCQPMQVRFESDGEQVFGIEVGCAQ